MKRRRRRPLRTRRRTSRDPGLDKKKLRSTIDKDQRTAHAKKIQHLKEQIRKARSGGPEHRASAKNACAEARKAAAERARAIIVRMRAEALKLANAEREGARWSCQARKRGHRMNLVKLRADLAAERKFRKDMLAIERGNRARRRGLSRATGRERASESDDEVRANIPSELVPMWNRVRKGIKGSPRKSRTEAFMQYAEENPREHYAGVEDKTDALVRELERQQRAGRRDYARPRRRGAR